MSGTINTSKSSFVIFGHGYDATNPDSGIGEEIPPIPPTPPGYDGYWFRYNEYRLMEQFNTRIPTANDTVDTSKISFTDDDCWFTIAPLPKTGTLPRFAEVNAFVESVTSRSGGSSLNPNIGDLVPISDTEADVIVGLIAFYQNAADTGNDYYKYGHWCVWNKNVGHWAMIGSGYGNNFSLSYTYANVADDNLMKFTIIADDTYFRLSAYHPTNPIRKFWTGQRLNLSDYTFFEAE